MKTSVLFPIASGALLTAFCLAAAAQGTPNKTLTRDELRACMDSEDSLKSRGAALKERNAKQNAEVEAYRSEDEQLKAEQKRVEESSLPGTRDRFDRKVRQHNARGKAAEESGKALTADADTFSKDLEAHNARCSGVAVKREDREALQKEREAAGKK